MTIYNREDSRTVLPQLEKRIGNLEDTVGLTPNKRTIDLDFCVAPAVLTGTSGYVYFTIPTGRTFPNGTVITKLACNMCGRVSNCDTTGSYFIRKTSGGTDVAPFDSTKDFDFYNVQNIAKTLSPSNMEVKLCGGTNIRVMFSEAAHFFTGDSTTTNKVNNNAATLFLENITVTLNIPKE